MRILRFCALLLLSYAAATVAEDKSFADKDKITRVLQTILPGETITGINPTPIANLYEVSMGPDVIYMSGDGRYVFRGDLMDMQARLNISEHVRAQARKKILENLTDNDYIEFSPERPKHVIYVFTDVECSFCRRLHRDVPVLNENGIGIRYLAYPRGGSGSHAFETMQAVWCADDRKQALTDAKNGVQFTSKKCKNPVADEYLLGQKFGVRGTPGIYTENGDELPGYAPPDELLKVVGQSSDTK
jgi:thiol:disulfide interchange protein DsbC